MSEHVILSRFCKSGDLHQYSRRFHALTMEQRRLAVALIKDGIDVEKAIRRAKRAEAKCAA